MFAIADVPRPVAADAIAQASRAAIEAMREVGGWGSDIVWDEPLPTGGWTQLEGWTEVFVSTGEGCTRYGCRRVGRRDERRCRCSGCR